MTRLLLFIEIPIQPQAQNRSNNRQSQTLDDEACRLSMLLLMGTRWPTHAHAHTHTRTHLNQETISDTAFCIPEFVFGSALWIETRVDAKELALSLTMTESNPLLGNNSRPSVIDPSVKSVDIFGWPIVRSTKVASVLDLVMLVACFELELIHVSVSRYLCRYRP